MSKRAAAPPTIFGVAIATAACGVWALITSCQQTPVNNPLRTFERAQKMDFVCMHVRDENNSFVEVAPTPVALSACAAVAPGTDGTTLAYHLYALVTQTVRGEIAVVDLTAQKVVDQNKENPGVNLLPVGQLPTDIASTPDGAMSYVTSADPFKPAIYALKSTLILGDSQTLVDAGTTPPTPNTLPSWPVCGLPQKPGPIAIVPRANGAFDLAVVLPGDAAQDAKIVLIDAKAFDTLPPGQLAPCPIKLAVRVSDATPPAWSPGVPWPDGVPYATVDSTTDLPRTSGVCENVAPPNADAGPDGGYSYELAPLRGSHAHPSWAVRDGDYLFVADNGLPVIHVYDLSSPNAIVELDPYVATSLVNPSRVVTVSQIAISPNTHDFRRYMYALDEKQGTVILYDVTNPKDPTTKTPLVRPHPELNPFQPVDRISFPASPVVSLAFARHDYPLLEINSIPLVGGRSGLICNPNGSIDKTKLSSSSSDNDLGAFYRTGESGGGCCGATGLAPLRLRGIFGMLTLANGAVAVVDVDDWDAPCRRPTHLDGTPPDGVVASGIWGQLGQTSKPSDPFGAPSADCTTGTCAVGTSSEGYFPISAPHRVRSNVLLRNDPTIGQNLPTIVGTPQLFLGTRPISAAEATGSKFSFLQTFLAREEPVVALDQDWAITFEGILPGFDGLAATLDTEDGWQSLTFTQSAGAFCAHGVQDQKVGRAMVSALEAEASYGLCTHDADCRPGAKCSGVDTKSGMCPTTMPKPTCTCTDSNLVKGVPTFATPPRAMDRTGDYIQIVDDLLPPNDSYWTLDEDAGGKLDCWTFDDGTTIKPGAPRYNQCLQTFGTATSPTLARELPILEAYDDRLVAGRFLYQSNNQSTQARIIGPRDVAGSTSYKLTQCCFHKQAAFRVRTGNQWLAVGSSSGYLHHIRPVPDTKRCVVACDERLALMNARAIDLVSDKMSGGTQGNACNNGGTCATGLTCASGGCMDRNTPFAIRNPLLAAQLVGFATSNVYTANQRDLTYKFQTRGRFVAQQVVLTSTNMAVSPQSMRYIEPLGQMGIVDGSTLGLGLVLIDLNTLVVAKTYN